MNKDQNSFLLFGNWKPLFDFLPDHEAGVLIKKLFAFAESGELEALDTLPPSIVGNYLFMVDVMKTNAEKWEDIKEARRQAGRIGGVKSGESRRMKQNEAKESKTKQNEANLRSNEANGSKTKHTVNVNVNGNVNVNDNVSTNVDIKEIDSKESIKKSASRFLPPTVEEVKAYCESRNNNIDANTFVDFYTSKGWKVGGQSMKDWRAAVRTWEKRHASETNEDAFEIASRRFLEGGELIG